jgi:ABC-type phosphonate transport system ATPase subunit
MVSDLLTATDATISVRGLTKTYGNALAVDGVDLAVQRGEVFALLGPHGAGKTTTVEILEGYRRRDAGEVSVLGADPERAGRSWQVRIGIVLQTAMERGDRRGFDPVAAEGCGLRGMGSRAAAVGGRLTVDSAPGRGTVVVLSVP